MSQNYFKNELYYYDLIYELKKICGELSSNQKNQETEERIERRKNDIITMDSKGTGPLKKILECHYLILMYFFIFAKLNTWFIKILK